MLTTFYIDISVCPSYLYGFWLPIAIFKLFLTKSPKYSKFCYTICSNHMCVKICLFYSYPVYHAFTLMYISTVMRVISRYTCTCIIHVFGDNHYNDKNFINLYQTNGPYNNIRLKDIYGGIHWNICLHWFMMLSSLLEETYCFLISVFLSPTPLEET
jgi:hypothetical protein